MALLIPKFHPVDSTTHIAYAVLKIAHTTIYNRDSPRGKSNSGRIGQNQTPYNPSSYSLFTRPAHRFRKNDLYTATTYDRPVTRWDP